MSKNQTRRSFLGNAAVATAGAIGGAVATRPVSGVEPIQRSGGTKYKFTLAGYSYRRLLTGENPELTLEDFVRDCAKFGLEGTEPTSYYFPKPVTNEYLCRLKATAFKLGLSISSTAVGNNFCHPPGERRDQEIASVKQWIDYAQVLGAPVIRLFSGKATKDQSVEEAHRLAVEGIEECCAYAGQKGIFLGLENHGGLTSTAEGMLTLIRDVKSTWFGAWMDTGNFHSADPYAELESIAPYTLHVQVKVVISDSEGRRQPTDFARLAKILERVNYRGWICLEYEESADPRSECPRYIDEMRKAFV
jgi:sugar phosphate isomerase/epimerase